MSYGFQALDAAGRLLLSDRVGAYGYRGRYVAEATPNYATDMACGTADSMSVSLKAGSGNWRVIVPKSVSASPPLPMFELPTHPNGCGWSGFNDSGTHWTLFFLANVQPVVHVFSLFTDDQRATVGSGLQVFDSNARLTFDSLGRQPLQLLRTPLAYSQPAFGRTYQGVGPSWSTVNALNNTTIDPGITLPAVVLCAGSALWESICEPDTSNGSGKTVEGELYNTWWRLLGRSGNTIHSFAYQYRNCVNSGGWLYPFLNPRNFTGQLMLADRSLYP